MLNYSVGTVSEILLLQNSFTIWNSSPLTINRKGDMGFLSGAVTRGSIPSAGTTIAIVSNAFLRPSRQLSIPVLDGGSGTPVARIELYPDGNMQFISGNMPLTANGVLINFL